MAVAERVVDPHLLEGVGVGDRGAGLGVDDRPVRLAGGDDVIGRVDQQAVVAESVEDRRSLGRRGGGELIDRLQGIGKLVGEEQRQRIVEAVGPRRAGKSEAAEEGENDERDRERALADGGEQSGLVWWARF